MFFLVKFNIFTVAKLSMYNNMKLIKLINVSFYFLVQ